MFVADNFEYEVSDISLRGMNNHFS